MVKFPLQVLEQAINDYYRQYGVYPHRILVDASTHRAIRNTFADLHWLVVGYEEEHGGDDETVLKYNDIPIVIGLPLRDAKMHLSLWNDKILAPLHVEVSPPFLTEEA